MMDSPAKPDMDSPEQIRLFVEHFYEQLLADKQLAPLFIDVAAIDIREHFPRIQAYWEKLLLGKDDYHRHTMNIHRVLNDKQQLTHEDFTRWLQYFHDTADRYFQGPKTERAKLIASRIAANMEKSLNS
ncbi:MULTISPECIES: group III truncated hemoglobin [Spongiibacter]|uniref:group III truncated hemoglobin n=1 Tax=Spongiibacter TaxID=630749 RepID=UPI001AFF663E|nr:MULTISPECIES: group III truncated hemoglobin [Spongiibacter]MBO6753027.1 group III truncated hemoglobin [Spongiibacter sp.]|tara:strand:+ start:19909 stop:20295 length:387 start_codon:yes stop_codon:yes gene_type:complete